MAVDPEDDDLWYVGSYANGLYVTRDSGTTWVQHIGGNVGAIAIDPNDPNTVYASSGSDLYGSIDRGITWNLVFSFPNPIPGPTLDSPTFIDSILVSVIDGTIVVGLTSQFHSARIYTSSDAGANWEIAFESEIGFHFWDLAEVSVNGYWYFCTEDSAHAANPVVMRSTDRGQSWEEMLPLTGIPTAGHGLNLEVHPVTQAVYFLTESGCLSSSSDFGETWSPYQCFEFGSVLLIDNNRPNRFFGGEFIRGLKVGGVYLSEDTGASFSFIGLSDRTITALALNGTSTTLFAVAFGYGIYELKSPDPGGVPPTLLLQKVSPSQIELSWSESDCSGARDYGIYAGILGNWYDHVAIDCHDGGAELSETSDCCSSGSYYFLVVPFNDGAEGSYGLASSGERPPGTGGTCQPIQVLGCS